MGSAANACARVSAMRAGFGRLPVPAAVLVAVLALVAGPAAAEAQLPGYDGPRTPDGRPDLNGIWQALTTAAWDIEAHGAREGVPAGQGVVEGGPLPYHPAPLARRDENRAHSDERDPLHRCYLPGVPRIMYMPFPFEITQTPDVVLMTFEYGRAVRQIHTDGSRRQEGFPPFWMGDSRGRWEGDVLVVDVAQFTGRTWFDRAGNFHSDALRLVERYTPIGPNHIQYDVRVEDPQAFTRPWTMSFPLYRRLERNLQILEYECLEFAEPFLPWDEAPAPGVPGAPER